MQRVAIVSICVIMVASFAARETLLHETVSFRIQGEKRILINEFGDGVPVTAMFVMSGNGLRAIDVQFSTDRMLDLHVLCELRQLDKSAPTAYAEIYRWTSVVERVAGTQWHRFAFPPLARSDDQLYSFRVQFIDTAKSANGRHDRVAIAASEDNPPRGGALWIGEARQPGSLYMRAHAAGETVYERLQMQVSSRSNQERYSGHGNVWSRRGAHVLVVCGVALEMLDGAFWEFGRDHPFIPIIVIGLAWAAFHLLLRIRYLPALGAAERGPSIEQPGMTQGDRLFLTAVIVGFLAINARLMNRGLEYDELYTASHFVVGVPLWKTATIAAVFNNHVAYSLLAGLSTRIFGPAEWALRLPALGFGAATIYLTWRFGRMMSGRPVAWSSGALLAISPFFGQWSRSARGYTGLTFMTLLSTWAFLSTLRTPSTSAARRHTGATVAATYFHLYGVWVFAIQYVIFGWLVLTRGRTDRESRAVVSVNADPHGLRALWRSFALIAVLAPALYTPVFVQLTQSAIGRGRTELRTGFPHDVFQALASTESQLLAISIAAVIVIGTTRLSKRLFEAIYLIALLVGPLVVMWLIMRPFDLYARFFIYWTPILVLLIAEGCLGVFGRPNELVVRKRHWWQIAPYVLTWAIGALIVVTWVKQDLQPPSLAGYREALRDPSWNTSGSTVAIGGDSEMFDYYLGKPLRILRNHSQLQRMLDEKQPVRVAYHNVPWNPSDMMDMAALLEKQCAVTNRGIVITFECNRRQR